jgi:hypothetical protein
VTAHAVATHHHEIGAAMRGRQDLDARIAAQPAATAPLDGNCPNTPVPTTSPATVTSGTPLPGVRFPIGQPVEQVGLEDAAFFIPSTTDLQHPRITPLGAMAGTVDLIQRCHTGLEMRDGVLWFNPRLPREISDVRMRVHSRGHWLSLSFMDKRSRFLSIAGGRQRPGSGTPKRSM